jgi:hypothetical protein
MVLHILTFTFLDSRRKDRRLNRMVASIVDYYELLFLSHALCIKPAIFLMFLNSASPIVGRLGTAVDQSFLL